METYDNPKSKRKYSGTVMFPTTHDICPEILDKALSTLQNLLDAKNEVLVVTKPHLECVVAICEKFKDNKNLSFRFTIGSSNNDILQTWEPGATLFEERFECLQHAFGLGFSTSISIEPILDVFGVESLVETLKPFVTDTIWLGKMNRVSSRSYDIDPSEIERIKSEQTRDNLISLRDKLDYPMIRWSELTKRFLNKDKK